MTILISLLDTGRKASIAKKAFLRFILVFQSHSLALIFLAFSHLVTMEAYFYLISLSSFLSSSRNRDALAVGLLIAISRLTPAKAASERPSSLKRGARASFYFCFPKSRRCSDIDLTCSLSAWSLSFCIRRFNSSLRWTFISGK